MPPFIIQNNFTILINQAQCKFIILRIYPFAK
nr:MAG TPA: hypothetical protein [Caudoviricetes sp.]